MKPTIKYQITIQLNNIKAKTIIFADINNPQNLWLWGEGESHDPADRCGGPYSIDDINNDDAGEKWFLFSPADSYFPAHWVISADSFESAYEILGEWKEDYFKIEEPDLQDYDEETLNYNGNGVPVDMEIVNGFEIRIISIKTTN